MPTSRSLRLERYVIDVLMPDLVGHDRQPSAFLVYLCLHARSAGAPRRTAAISLRGIAEATGLSKSIVQVAIHTLKRRKLVVATAGHATAVPAYRVLRPWLPPRARQSPANVTAR